jgi:hypothetical protein
MEWLSVIGVVLAASSFGYAVVSMGGHAEVPPVAAEGPSGLSLAPATLLKPLHGMEHELEEKPRLLLLPAGWRLQVVFRGARPQ